MIVTASAYIDHSRQPVGAVALLLLLLCSLTCFNGFYGQRHQWVQSVRTSECQGNKNALYNIHALSLSTYSLSLLPSHWLLWPKIKAMESSVPSPRYVTPALTACGIHGSRTYRTQKPLPQSVTAVAGYVEGMVPTDRCTSIAQLQLFRQPHGNTDMYFWYHAIRTRKFVWNDIRWYFDAKSCFCYIGNQVKDKKSVVICKCDVVLWLALLLSQFWMDPGNIGCRKIRNGGWNDTTWKAQSIVKLKRKIYN